MTPVRDPNEYALAVLELLRSKELDPQRTAVIAVDLQNSFFPRWIWKSPSGMRVVLGGELPVPGAHGVIPLANALLELPFPVRVGTGDDHYKPHPTFASTYPGKKPFDTVELDGKTYILWPEHCVRDTRGADFHPELHSDLFTHIIRKGQRWEAFSAFHRTGLAELLWRENIEYLVGFGLATDHCVKATLIDAAKEGFWTAAILPACRGVTPETTKEAIAEMGAEMVRLIDHDPPRFIVPGEEQLS